MPSAAESARAHMKGRPIMTAIDAWMSPDMRAATRLTREGHLAEATALMRRLLHGKRHSGLEAWPGSTGWLVGSYSGRSLGVPPPQPQYNTREGRAFYVCRRGAQAWSSGFRGWSPHR